MNKDYKDNRIKTIEYTTKTEVKLVDGSIKTVTDKCSFLDADLETKFSMIYYLDELRKDFTDLEIKTALKNSKLSLQDLITYTDVTVEKGQDDNLFYDRYLVHRMEEKESYKTVNKTPYRVIKHAYTLLIPLDLYNNKIFIELLKMKFPNFKPENFDIFSVSDFSIYADSGLTYKSRNGKDSSISIDFYKSNALFTGDIEGIIDENVEYWTNYLKCYPEQKLDIEALKSSILKIYNENFM